jgi:hypothetical protein
VELYSGGAGRAGKSLLSLIPLCVGA